MCGIAGYIDFSGLLDEPILRGMTDRLNHRGPDDCGVAIFEAGAAHLGLGHARLSILDLSNAGHQPMTYGQLAVIFNGEIYNFREIRRVLEQLGHQFRTRTDTEVILHAFVEWGIECLHRFIGMFAFVLYDAGLRRLYLVRDRAGVKPLFVYRGRECLLFASELKAFHGCPLFPARISLPPIRSYFALGYVPGDECIYEGGDKVDAGEYWIFDLETRNIRRERYWSIEAHYQKPTEMLGYADSVEQLEDLLRSACAYRMVSDVPVGVFLSGGYDSTAITAILQAMESAPLRTFTIGFTEGNDEAPSARRTAAMLGTEHHEFYCSPREAQEVLPRLATIYDEPFADTSAIPTFLVSQLAREHVKVGLSADGGDELFAGYQTYEHLGRRTSTLTKLPGWSRRGLGGVGELAARLTPKGMAGLHHRLSGLAASLDSADDTMVRSLHERATRLPDYYLDGLFNQPVAMARKPRVSRIHNRRNPLEAAMAHDYGAYLKDDILVKVDRATMAFGLEGREPLLDHRLAEFAASLPLEYKFDGRVKKRILRDVVHRYVPAETMDRPKSGFSLPIHAWLRGELSHVLEECCNPAALRQTGFFDEIAITKWIDQFKKKQLHYTPLISRLVIFQLWWQRWQH